MVVYFINDPEYGNFKSEVQSYQIAYEIWGCSCGLLLIIWIVCALNDKEASFQKWLLWPFRIEVKNSVDTSSWVIPLVSMAVAIIVGFGANYGLEERFVLECKPSCADEGGLCYENPNLCCKPVSSYEIAESGHFLGRLASNALDAWAVVKATA